MTQAVRKSFAYKAKARENPHYVRQKYQGMTVRLHNYKL